MDYGQIYEISASFRLWTDLLDCFQCMNCGQIFNTFVLFEQHVDGHAI